MPVGASAHINSTKIGSCPHGLPAGACPICNGMAGGNSTTKRDTPRNVGEMTYNQCAAIGAMLKAQKAARQRMQTAQQKHIQAIVQFQKNLENIHQRILDITFSISKSTPAIIAAPINFVLTQVVVRIIRIIASIPVTFANVIQKFIDITDKLTAIYGEFKAAASKIISNVWDKTKKRLKSIFFIFGAEDANNEEKKVDETKKAFHIKTFIHRLSQKLKRKDK